MQVVAAVIQDGPRVLVARRASGRTHSGLWEFPGGKVEPGESPEDALIREIWEELTMPIQVHERLASASHQGIHLSAYRAYRLGGEPVLKDHDAVRWVLPSELPALPMPTLDRMVIPDL